MSNIIALANASIPEGEENPRIVALLENFLEAARRGELVSVAVCATERGGTARQSWSVGPGQGFYDLIGVLAVAQARLTGIVNERHVTLPISEDDSA